MMSEDRFVAKDEDINFMSEAEARLKKKKREAEIRASLEKRKQEIANKKKLKDQK